MIRDHFQRFLGVDQSSDPTVLLGLEADCVDTVRIDAALRDRIARLFKHPDGRSPDAEVVRNALRQAAEELKRRAERQRMTGVREASGNRPKFRAGLPISPHHQLPPRRSASSANAPVFNLTPFDRMVLAVLVASGGWNARSRTQLVALASAWGVTVQGLMRVVKGLSEYGQSGGARLGVQEITSGQSMSNYLPPASTGYSSSPALLDRLTESLSTELKRENAWPTIKLSLIFGVITLAACIIGVRLAFVPTKTATPPVDPTPPRAVENSSRPVPVPPPPPEQKERLATFPKTPTFLGNAVPPDALAAVSQFAALPGFLDESARKLTVEDVPSEVVFRHWEITINTIGAGWFLGDVSTRNKIEEKLFEALRSAGDRPTVSDRLLGYFLPQGSTTEPLDIWRGAWKVGTLARISEARSIVSLPPVVVEKARALLRTQVPEIVHEDATFETAARHWLNLLIPQIIATMEIDQQTYDRWELWLAAQRGLGRGDENDAAIMNALTAVLETDTDLARPGPTSDVLGRLIAIALENPSDIVKQKMLELFDTEKITARDLWVLTSMLATSDAARWFPDRLVLPELADQRHRWRIRDEVATVWPASNRGSGADAIAQGRPILVDEKVAARWSGMLESALDETPAAHPAEIMRQIVGACRLNEAAEALAGQNPIHADRVLDELRVLPPGPTNPVNVGPSINRGRTTTPGAPSGIDGEWTRAYQDIGRNPEQRIQQLQLLRVGTGGDLGLLDSETLVKEAYRGQPQEVRTAAQEIVSRFSAGPNMSMAMLDQFGDAPTTDVISRVVQEFTGQTLPAVRSTVGVSWIIAARLALLKHALDLQPTTGDQVDDQADQLVDSYLMRLALLKREARPSMVARSPQDAARLLAESVLNRAQMAIVVSPAPDSLPGLQRRRATRLRLADGVTQTFIAQQLTVLDGLVYLLVAEQPPKRSAALELLRKSADVRSDAATALEQALHVERSIARMWKLRLAPKGERAEPIASASPDSSVGNSVATSPGSAPAPAATATPPVRTSPKSPKAVTVSTPARLAALRPENPQAYFDLAEDISDASVEKASRDLAKQLFALAGALDPVRLGRSACLALATLEPNTNVRGKRRLRALASLLGPGMSPISPSADQSSSPVDSGVSSTSAAIALGEAFGHYRHGQGPKAAEALRKSGAEDLLNQSDRLIPGGAARFQEDLKFYRGQTRPTLSPENLTRMLRLEIALLSGAERSWSADMLITASAPLIEVDPDRLAETLGVDVTRPYYRNGRWVERQ